MSNDVEDVLDYQREVRNLRAELAQLRDGGTTTKPPKRLTLSEILQAHLDRMAHAGGERSSVELTRNAKGDTQIKVTVRTGDSDDTATVESATAKAREIYDALRMVYPMAGPAD